jgi:hypothetical protein
MAAVSARAAAANPRRASARLEYLSATHAKEVARKILAISSANVGPLLEGLVAIPDMRGKTRKAARLAITRASAAGRPSSQLSRSFGLLISVAIGPIH